MSMEKADFAKGMDKMGKRVSKEEKSDPEPPVKQTRQSSVDVSKNKGVRVCPFRSAIDNKYCGPDCKLFRTQKDGHNCPMQEIYALSWKLEEIKKSIGQK